MDVLKEIERDIRAFADPASPVVVEASSALWERNGIEYSAQFIASGTGSFPDVNFMDRRMSYRSFLSSEWMSDLLSFAEFIIKTNKREYEYLETSAHLNIDDVVAKEEKRPAAEAIRLRASTELPFLSTRILLVHGEAGSGKTITLKEVRTRQALAFKENRVDSLFFFIDAQGRALSRLEDAMAKDLQDLRSKFTYAAIGPLTRHNLIIPIIDGFDELLGSGGYDEAFSSLAAFLATLNGQGSVVASARSAFFDYRNFYENAKRFSGDGRLNYVVETVDILPWSQDQIKKYFLSVGEKLPNGPEMLISSLEQIQKAMDENNRKLLSKPFYSSLVANFLADNGEIRSDEDLLDQLVDAFIEREHTKLLDKDRRPMLSKKGHRAFLTGLAEEMWWQESRRLDVGTVQALAELITEQYGLPPTAAHAIVERVSSYAFLTSDPSVKRFLRFEHEVFYGYFLAHKLQDLIEREPFQLRRFLGRSVVDEIIVDQSVRLMGSEIGRRTRAVESVSSSLRPYLSEVLARENAGLIIAAILRSSGTIGVATTFKNVIFRKVKFGNVELTRPRFENCDLEEVDLSQTRFIRPEFIQTPLRNVTVDLSTTCFEGADPSLLDQIFGLIVRNGTTELPTGRLFAPEEIATVMAHMGVVVSHAKQSQQVYHESIQKRIDLLDRFLRKMERRFYISEEELASFPFARDYGWNLLWKMLKNRGLLEEQIIAKSGPRQPLIRLSVPPEILRKGEAVNDPSVPINVKDFWRDLLRI